LTDTPRTLPLIAVVTPATLTVHLAAQPNQTMYNVPVPSIDYGIIQDQTFALINQGGPPSYTGPAPRIVRLMSSVTSQGSILQIAAPYPNCTYSVPFYGPSISCAPTTTGNSSFQEDISEVIKDSDCDGCHGIDLTYVGFVPQFTDTTLSDAALEGLKEALNNPYSIQTPNTLDQVSTDRARLYATILNSSVASSASGYKTIECGLYNTSYVVNFTFSNGQQDVIVTNMTQLNGVNSNLWYTLCGDNWGPCAGPGMAYNSILDTLGNLIIGSLAVEQYGSINSNRTQLASTVLMETMEIQGLLRADPSISGLSEPLSIANMTMSEALEQIVLNTTLSLFSDSYFLSVSLFPSVTSTLVLTTLRQNSTTASILPVLVSTPQNAYLYSSRNLLIAYGVGILIATIIVTMGIVCIWESGNSFGASFSAILRTTRNTQLDAIVPAREAQGAFPLSKQLGKTKLILRRQVGEADMRTAFAVVDGAEGGEEGTELTKPSAKRRMSSESLLERTQVNVGH
jgi:hypothetical protein